jgi:hypothetical protein
MSATLQAPVSPPESIERSIVRLADAVGSLNPRRSGRIVSIGDITEVQAFASILNVRNGGDMLDAACPHCGKVVPCARVVLTVSAESWGCDECRDAAQKRHDTERIKKLWDKICPELYRKTDPNHPEFPKAIYDDVRKGDPLQSLFLYGPTGSCKTRVGMRLLRSHLISGHSVSVIWPHQLRTLTQGYDNSAFEACLGVDVLLLDDALLTACRESKLVDCVKMLVDARMMRERRTIITSQIGSEDDIAKGKEFGEAKSADVERIKALLRRLREKFRVVPFIKAKAGQGAF